MAKPTRRDFLKIGAAAVGSAALSRLLAACGQTTPPASVPSSAPVLPASPPPYATAGQEPTPTVAQSTPTPWNGPDIAVARNGSPEEMVRRAIAALGGMGMFVAKGANVVVKPNICIAYSLPQFAATTNPWVVGTLVKLCLEAGAASVKVMDFPFGGTQDAAYSFSGIQEQVEAAGGQMTPMPTFKFVETAIAGGLHLKKVYLFEDIRKADVVINVPVGKVHSLSRLTLGLKNLMGVVKDRSVLHAHISQNLADIASLVKPRLTVLDAVRIMVSNGPTGGSLDDVKTLNTVVATPDIVAADSYGATLFGLRPEDLGYVTAAAKMGLGRSDLQNMKIEQIDVGTV